MNDSISEHSRHNVETARTYLKAIEDGATGPMLARFFDPEAVVETLPNRITPRASRRNLNEVLAAAERGRKILSKQRYEIMQTIAEGDRLALEVLWSGTLLIPFDTLPAGSELRAHVVTVLEFRAGKILAQRQYDCYEPW